MWLSYTYFKQDLCLWICWSKHNFVSALSYWEYLSSSALLRGHSYFWHELLEEECLWEKFMWGGRSDSPSPPRGLEENIEMFHFNLLSFHNFDYVVVIELCLFFPFRYWTGSSYLKESFMLSMKLYESHHRYQDFPLLDLITSVRNHCSVKWEVEQVKSTTAKAI